ncbi:MAG: aminotransferase class III-fold pyridoxal phosphate-dependent enzyme [Mesorhizobium sp.]|nr:MAG: aminotransferase class III-fold pyridoxal phosphate-dependent enzyme [Mesorhizobium sp.]
MSTTPAPSPVYRADRTRITELNQRELERFAARTGRSKALLDRARKVMPAGTPMSWMAGYYMHPQLYVARGEGARFFDVDGNAYIDMNVADLSATLGYGIPAVEEPMVRQFRNGAHYLLPTEDAVVAAHSLGRLMGLPFWQFTLAASGANTEIMRIARHITGRRKLVVFEGKYHGHIEETLVKFDGERVVPEYQGLSGRRSEDTIILPFNDLDAVAAALESREVALVLTEPALTNCSLVLPDPGYLEGLRRITAETGTMLCIDESHTFSFAYGGLTRLWNLQSDFITLGKGLGSGLAFAAYGMTDTIGDHVEKHLDILHRTPGIGLGGTLYGNALSMACARAVLEHVLTEDAFNRISALGSRMADGIDAICRDLDLPCRAFRIGPRSGLCLTPELPRNYAEAHLSMDFDMLDARRVFMANRGYWDCIVSAGPQASFAHGKEDIDGYVDLLHEFMKNIK